MRRRDFITGIAAADAVWPLAVRAQPSPMLVIGFMSGRWPEESAGAVAAFHQGLAETGYVDGRNVMVEYRWAEGRYDRLPAIARELLERRVTVLAAVGGGVSGLAAKAATTTTPIVFSSGGDAVALGLVASLNRPAGNVTGVNLVFGALGAKRLELLRAVIPKARSIAALVNPAYPSAAAEVEDVQAAARALGLKILVLEATVESAIAPAFEILAAERIEGLLGLRRSLPPRPAQPDRRARRALRGSGGLLRPRLRAERRSDELRREHHRRLSPGGSLCWPHSSGRQTRRSARHL